MKQDQLSQIWSQVNLKHPGTLIKEELFMALALIALAQNSNGQIFSNDHLYHLTEIPLPQFRIEQQQSSSLSSIPTYQQEDFADFSTFEQNEKNLNRSDEMICTEDYFKSSETESIASLDLPIITDEISQKSFTHTSSNNHEDTQNVNTSINSSKTGEYTRFSSN